MFNKLDNIRKKIKAVIEQIKLFYSTWKTRLGINKWIWRRIKLITQVVGTIFTLYRVFKWIIVALFNLF